MKFNWNDKDWYIHKTLAYELDSCIYNIKKDWDFLILISGDRMVRVGKSVLAMTVASYLAHGLERKKLNIDAFNMNNIFFDNKVLIEESQKRAKYSVILYDEAREGLASSKSMKSFQEDLIDFFNECGQLNHIFIIVIPDFFELKETIAVGRSEFLLNVYRQEKEVMRDVYNTGVKTPVTILQRGKYEFYSRPKKANLYDKAKSMRRKWYGLVKKDFDGDFTDQYPVGEEEYKTKKKEALTRFNEKHKQMKEQRISPVLKNFSRAIMDLREEAKVSFTELGKRYGVSDSYFHKALSNVLKEEYQNRNSAGFPEKESNNVVERTRKSSIGQINL